MNTHGYVRKSNNHGETSKQKRWLLSEVPWKYLFEGDSFSWGWLQAKLIKEEFDVAAVDPRRPISPNKTTLITDSSFYVYHVVFDKLLKKAGHGLHIIVSKCLEISHCN